jgi:MFS transporter, ACS family, hexuronate transporter
VTDGPYREGPAPLSNRRAWLVTLVATSTMAVSYLDRQVLAALAPTVQAELHIDDSEYGWLQSAFSLAYLASAPLAGLLLERIGIRRGMLIAVLSWSVVAAIHAGAPSFMALFALRLALGATESPSFPGSAGAIARVQPDHQRARAMGVLYTGSSFGAMVAPRLATAMTEWLGSWRGAFIGVALVGLLWVPLWLLVTGEAKTRAKLDPPAEARKGPGLLTVGRPPGVLRASLLVASCSPLFAFVLLWGSKLLVDVHGVPQAEVGHYLWLPPLLFDVGAVLFGHFASTHARAHGAGSVPTAIAIVALLFALCLGALPFANGPWQVVAIAGLAMAGGAGLFAILSADMITRVGPEVAATAGGFTASVQSVMYVIANPLFGAGVEAFGGYDVVLFGITLWLVPGAVIWLLWRPQSAALTPPGESVSGVTGT